MLGISAVPGVDVVTFGGSGNGVRLLDGGIEAASVPAPASFPSIAMLSNGAFLLVWTGDLDSNLENGYELLYAQRYSEGLQPIGVAVTLVIGQNIVRPTIASTEDKFFISWQGGDPDNSVVYGQVVGADGTPVGSPVQLDSSSNSPQSSPAIDILPDGRLLSAWRDGNGLGARIKARFIDIW